MPLNIRGLFSLHSMCLGKVPSKESKISFFAGNNTKALFTTHGLCFETPVCAQFFSPPGQPKAIVKC